MAIALAGGVAFMFLPVAPLPQVDFPTISVAAALPGASPEIMASSVATPLERQFGRIAGVTEMTSASYLGTTSITLQFDLNRDIDGAARDVQAAINAARSYLPTNLPSNPTYRKVNPADAPIMIVALTSDVYDRGRMYDAASTMMAQSLSQSPGSGGGDCWREFVARRARRNQSDSAEQLWSWAARRRQFAECRRTPTCPRGKFPTTIGSADILDERPVAARGRLQAADRRLPQWRCREALAM